MDKKSLFNDQYKSSAKTKSGKSDKPDKSESSKGTVNPSVKKLEDTRRAIAEVDELRSLAASLGRKEKLAAYDKAAVDLRNIERELITKLGKDIAASVKAGGEPLDELAARLRARIEKMGRLPRRLDKISKVILEISAVIGWK